MQKGGLTSVFVSAGYHCQITAIWAGRGSPQTVVVHFLRHYHGSDLCTYVGAHFIGLVEHSKVLVLGPRRSGYAESRYSTCQHILR